MWWRLRGTNNNRVWRMHLGELARLHELMRINTPTRPRTHTHARIHRSIYCFPRQQWFANAPQCCVIRTLPLLFGIVWAEKNSHEAWMLECEESLWFRLIGNCCKRISNVEVRSAGVRKVRWTVNSYRSIFLSVKMWMLMITEGRVFLYTGESYKQLRWQSLLVTCRHVKWSFVSYYSECGSPSWK